MNTLRQISFDQLRALESEFRRALGYSYARFFHSPRPAPPPRRDPYQPGEYEARLLRRLEGERAAAAQVPRLAREVAQLRRALGNSDWCRGAVFGALPVCWRDEWRTPAVVELAAVILDDRRFDLMLQLADELQRAGCTRGVLDRLRNPEAVVFTVADSVLWSAIGPENVRSAHEIAAPA